MKILIHLTQNIFLLFWYMGGIKITYITKKVAKTSHDKYTTPYVTLT